jgi:hypothetical protein
VGAALGSELHAYLTMPVSHENSTMLKTAQAMK